MAEVPASQVMEAAQGLWNSTLQPAGCPQCKRAFLVLSNRLGSVCPRCGKGKLESQPARMRPEAPELVVPFKLSRGELQVTLEWFVKELWLRPADFTPENLLARLAPIYLPLWLVDADVSGDWQAEIGFDYQVKSSRENFKSGNWQTETVMETRIRWEARRGEISRHYDNSLVPALTDFAALTRWLGDYFTNKGQSARFDPAVLGQALVQIPDLPPESAWEPARGIVEKRAAAECAQAADAQHVRSVNLALQYTALNWTELLLPAYLTWYVDDDGQTHVIYLNDQSAKVNGIRIASQTTGWRWAGISAAIALALGLLGALLMMLLPPLGGIFIFLAICVGAFAIVPAVYPATWNSRQKE